MGVDHASTPPNTTPRTRRDRANEYTDQPITAGLIPLTCNEIRR